MWKPLSTTNITAYQQILIMKNSYKLILLFPLIFLHFLCMPKISHSAQCCATIKCNTRSSFNAEISIKFPFRLHSQPVSCGCRGFELYCDDKLGLLLELPNAGNFTVDYIDYYSREIELSDPNDCLPQKLLTLDLTKSPFRGVRQTKDYKVYTCSFNGHHFDFYDEEINCVSGSDNTVIRKNASSSSTRIIDPKCLFLKYVSVPTKYDFDLLYVSSYSRIYLTWDEHICESCEEPQPQLRTDSGLVWKVVLGVTTSIAILLLIICFDILRRGPPTIETSTTRTINDIGATTTTTSAPTSCGLDQITIDSYPVTSLEDTARSSKPDHNMCPICLSEYSLEDTMKMLPSCLHRFHSECIDIWLKSQPSCPICRTSPSQKLNDTLI